MKKIIMMAFAGLLMAAVTSCDKNDELVPLNTGDKATGKYRLEDPTPLTGEEQEEVNNIRTEYYNNVPQ